MIFINPKLYSGVYVFMPDQVIYIYFTDHVWKDRSLVV